VFCFMTNGRVESLTLQSVIEILLQYRDRHGVDAGALVRIEISPDETVDVDAISYANDAIVLSSVDYEED